MSTSIMFPYVIGTIGGSEGGHGGGGEIDLLRPQIKSFKVLLKA